MEGGPTTRSKAKNLDLTQQPVQLKSKPKPQPKPGSKKKSPPLPPELLAQLPDVKPDLAHEAETVAGKDGSKMELEEKPQLGPGPFKNIFKKYSEMKGDAVNNVNYGRAAGKLFQHPVMGPDNQPVVKKKRKAQTTPPDIQQDPMYLQLLPTIAELYQNLSTKSPDKIAQQIKIDNGNNVLPLLASIFQKNMFPGDDSVNRIHRVFNYIRTQIASGVDPNNLLADLQQKKQDSKAERSQKAAVGKPKRLERDIADLCIKDTMMQYPEASYTNAANECIKDITAMEGNADALQGLKTYFKNRMNCIVEALFKDPTLTLQGAFKASEQNGCLNSVAGPGIKARMTPGFYYQGTKGGFGIHDGVEPIPYKPVIQLLRNNMPALVKWYGYMQKHGGGLVTAIPPGQFSLQQLQNFTRNQMQEHHMVAIKLTDKMPASFKMTMEAKIQLAFAAVVLSDLIAANKINVSAFNKDNFVYVWNEAKVRIIQQMNQ